MVFQASSRQMTKNSLHPFSAKLCFAFTKKNLFTMTYHPQNIVEVRGFRHSLQAIFAFLQELFLYLGQLLEICQVFRHRNKL